MSSTPPLSELFKRAAEFDDEHMRGIITRAGADGERAYDIAMRAGIVIGSTKENDRLAPLLDLAGRAIEQLAKVRSEYLHWEKHGDVSDETAMNAIQDIFIDDVLADLRKALSGGER